MNLPLLLALLALAAVPSLAETAVGQQHDIDVRTLVSSVTATVQDISNAIEDVRKSVYHLSRQTMLQQFLLEENMRTQGDSGIRSVRGSLRGLNNYETSTHIGEAMGAIHDHANFNSTLGMGEIAVAMNGVYFRTRHNDYKLRKPSGHSAEYDATEPIPYPGVPPEVQGTVQEQIEEMREWFKAFRTQNATLRDYREYFKPTLCYLEAGWTMSERLDEPFSSDRHHLEANSWVDLQEKIRFAAYSGVKNSRENWAYLPTSIIQMNASTGEPVYAQWNYRILCQPINRDIPLSNLVPMDDLTFRMAKSRTKQQALKSRAARFKLYDPAMSETYQLLDEVFYEIPGRDNIPSGVCQQMTFNDGPMYQVKRSQAGRLLNTCFYHRQYKFYKNGAMGLSTYPRGFNDDSLFVAQTHQEKIAPVGLKRCVLSRKRGKGGKRMTTCRMEYNRFTYAIPLEIVFLTPLLSWNPHNFTIHQERGMAAGNGNNGVTSPFNGVDSAHYYMTPMEFFKDVKKEKHSADTSGGVAKVKDPHGVVRRCRASGTHIFLPNIQGLGRVRLRYPIAPVYGEGSSVWKELNALKDMVLENERKGPPKSVLFQMSTTVKDPPGEHTHEFLMSYTQFLAMKNDKAAISVTTTLNQQHTHDLMVRYEKNKRIYHYVKCGSYKKCKDEHNYRVFLLTRNEYTES